MELRLQSEWMLCGHHGGLHRSVCTGHCNSMPENELTNNYSIRRK